MRNIINYLVKYPKLVTLAILSIMVFGYLGMLSMQSTFFPLERPRYIFINTTLPGASPEEIEESIVLKIEENLKSVTGVQRITSQSKENFAQVKVELMTQYDPDDILQEVKNAVNSISSFPVGMEPAVIWKEEILTFAMNFAVTGSNNLLDLKEEAERIERELMLIDGISKIDVTGYPNREIEISLNESSMRSYQLTFQDIGKAVKDENIDLTGGRVKGESQEFIIRSRNKSNKAIDIEEIVIKALPSGQIIYLKDVATVKEQWEDSPTRTYVDGERSVNVKVNSTSSEDILISSTAIRTYIEIYNDSPNPFHLKIIMDGSKTLRERIDLLTDNGITGTILVFVILALFLNFRLSFWVALGIPISFAGMFIIANFFGLTINVLSLFGMIIVVGILVDDGVVISENIFQHYEKGKSALRASIDGTLEVLPSVISSVITTCASFSLFFFIDGRMGDFFSDIAFVVISTLLFSLIEAGLLLPVHIAESKGLRDDRPTIFDRTMAKVEAVMNYILYILRNRIYAPVLALTLRTPYGIGPIGVGIIIPFCMLVISITAFKNGFIKFSFFPMIERDNIFLSLELPAGTPSSKTEALIDYMEERANIVNEKIKASGFADQGVFTKIEKTLGPQTNIAFLSIGLVAGDQRSIRNTTITDSLRKEIGEIPEADKLTYGVASPFGMPISISLRSNDLKSLGLAKSELRAIMNGIPELVDTYDSDKKGVPEIEVALNEKAKLLGVTLRAVTSQIRNGFFGFEVQRLQNGKDEEKVWVRYKEEDRKTFQQLENMRIRLGLKGEFPLKEIVSFKMTRSPLVINHIDGQREIRIYSDVKSENVSTGDMITRLDEEVLTPLMNKYPTLSYSFEGQMKTTRKVRDSVSRVGPIILIIVFIMIVLTFRSFSQSMIVMPFLIPFSLIGVIAGHWVHGHHISILSMLGIIALIGVLINDSLVFISSFNQKIKRGIPFFPAVFQTGIARFRPIMLTSVTTIAGLSPLIMETSFQAQFLIPMAISIAYGLGSATIQTLIMIPAMLVIRNWVMRHLVWLWSGRKPSHEEVEPAYKEFKHEQQLLAEELNN
jgi:multidrug efflux pump subunit AcrB